MKLRILFGTRVTEEIAPPTEAVTVTRLTPEVYAQLERSVAGHTAVRSSTTSLEAGFQLGIAHVMKIIREGIVNERT